MGLQLITEPAIEPVSLTEARVRVGWMEEDNTHDELLYQLILSARREVEQYTRKALITQTWRLSLDGFEESKIYLPRPPLISVTSIQYDPETGSAVTLVEGTDYEVITSSKPGYVMPVFNGVWPVARHYPDSVRITYTAGFGPEQSDVREEFRQLILGLVAFKFDNPGGDTQATSFGTQYPQHLMWSMKALRSGTWGKFYELD